MTGELERRTNWSTSRFLHSEQAVPLDPDSASGLRSTRSRLIALALIYAGFIIYGSLLPFEFHALPLGDAWQKFLETPYLALGVMKRADWVANCVLYVPIGFLLSGALSSSAKRTGRAFGCLIAFVLGTAIAIGVEFTQLYFPLRTVSLNDLGAEIVGSLIGAALWFSQGPKLLSFMRSISDGGTAAIRAAIVIYLVAYFALAMFPYDFLVSWSEIEWKLTSSGIGLAIAGNACESGLRCTVKFVIEIAAMMPLGVLIALMRPPNRGNALAYACPSGIAHRVRRRVLSDIHRLRRRAGRLGRHAGRRTCRWLRRPSYCRPTAARRTTALDAARGLGRLHSLCRARHRPQRVAGGRMAGHRGGARPPRINQLPAVLLPLLHD